MENKYYLLEIVFEDDDETMYSGIFDSQNKVNEVIAEFEQIKMEVHEDMEKRVAEGEDIEDISIESYLNGNYIYLLSEGFSIKEFDLNVDHIPLFIKNLKDKNI